ncbi:hypothetical protein NC661_05475 [Aquibacillus koreensis]|uniref:Capsular biosynthesis protein CpsH n=1 Tax=Aquibacillus koreensis TaxID=279446 RepID=A0A9X3WH54_9BACI|nr:hypothetical protein [Aquibacillus koreensis]MCT2534633.1 hypothetical protein [Aquibacillus koreensis]MDC3419817.1 hypothetical protein [Aquibacillus koreensis]
MNRKKVLYIGTPIFNYHKKIIEEYESQGYSVDYYNDRPSESSFVKGAIKVKKNLMDSLIKKYFNKIMSETSGRTYDLVFIVNCKVFTPEMLKQLRKTQKSARFVLYMWDSLTLYPSSKELISIFDKAYSFDSDDCNEIEGLSFLPLFYSKDFEKLGQEDVKEYEFDIVSVCTAHPNRYKTMHNLFPILEAKGINVFSYMFLNKLQFLYNKVFVKEFKNAKKSEFKFKPLSEKENLAVLRKSNVVFDMQHNKQSGLTMRTIETFGAKRKMITSNGNIKKYDFYNSNNIFVLENQNPDEIIEFLENSYEPINSEIYEKYSLSHWLKTIINEEENNYLR